MNRIRSGAALAGAVSLLVAAGVDVAGSALPFVVPDGGSARESAFVEIGTVALPKGMHHLTLRATDTDAFNRVDIARIYLEPAS